MPKPIDKRTPAGKFARGNAGGPGGPRPGSGRKPNKAEILEAIEAIEVEWMGERKPAAYAAFATMVELMRQDDPHPVRLRACEAVLNRLLGKPTETVNVTGGNTDTLMAMIAAAKPDAVKAVADKLSAAAESKG